MNEVVDMGRKIKDILFMTYHPDRNSVILYPYLSRSSKDGGIEVTNIDKVSVRRPEGVFLRKNLATVFVRHGNCEVKNEELECKPAED